MDGFHNGGEGFGFWLSVGARPPSGEGHGNARSRSIEVEGDVSVRISLTWRWNGDAVTEPLIVNPLLSAENRNDFNEHRRLTPARVTQG